MLACVVGHASVYDASHSHAGVSGTPSPTGWAIRLLLLLLLLLIESYKGTVVVGSGPLDGPASGV